MTTRPLQGHRALVLSFLLIFVALPVPVLAQSPNDEIAPEQSGVDWIIQLDSEWMSFSSKSNLSQVLGDADQMRVGADGQTILATFSGDTTASSSIARLWSHPDVAYVEPDIFLEFQYDFVPDDMYFGDQLWAQTVNLPSAWAVTAGAEDVIVAVVDSGVRPDHPDLQGKLVEGYSWVGMNTDSFDPSDTVDVAGHGTAVAGIVAATGNNQIGVAGASMNVKVMPLRIGEQTGGPVSRVALAVEHAVDNGAKVVNLSLGSETQSTRLEQALQYAEVNDVIVVAAAGNKPNEVSFPGSSPQTIGVGATVLDGSQLAYFSSRLSTTDLVAPGMDVLSTYWSLEHGNHYRAVNGTSFSTPIVAGTAALIHSVNPDLNVHEVRSLLQETSVMHFAEQTTGTGYGLLDSNSAVRQALLPSFGGTWLPADEPVASFATQRSWLWGPYAWDLKAEPYLEAENGLRLVAYFDKSRMEITDVYGDRSSEWYVTNGLLVNELISGDMQVGDFTFESRSPANVPVAGDPENNNGPTYASFSGLENGGSAQENDPIIGTLSRDGTVGVNTSLGDYGVFASEFIPETGHFVANVFWDYLNSTGTIRQPGAYVEGQIFSPTFFATGFPVSEAYWARVTVDGVEQDVLIQCFERRCLTYTPSNDLDWRVEMGNVGQHYYRWRYDEEPGGAVGQDPVAYALENLR